TFALFTERTSGITREGKPYFQCRWKDRFRQVSVMIWAESPWFHDCEKAWILGQAYRLKVSYTHHDKYGPQCEILQWRAVTAEDKNSGFDLAHLVDSSRFHLEDLWNKLLDFVDSQIRQPAVKELIQHLYQVHAETLKSLPASDGKFYPFRGGWLEHMVSLSNTCLLLCQHYELHYSDHAIVPDRDLVLAGALLHDLGRVQEFHTDPLGILLQPTVPGKLFGHVMLSRDMVR
ncbi:MAG TPA: HD domain-containing protein, partial [Gemmatales bacterium]|nr:HD domain-containing protein [Gemmatales bacterium]